MRPREAHWNLQAAAELPGKWESLPPERGLHEGPASQATDQEENPQSDQARGLAKGQPRRSLKGFLA
jgi:hypothetical protein